MVIIIMTITLPGSQSRSLQGICRLAHPGWRIAGHGQPRVLDHEILRTTSGWPEPQRGQDHPQGHTAASAETGLEPDPLRPLPTVVTVPGTRGRRCRFPSPSHLFLPLWVTPATLPSICASGWLRARPSLAGRAPFTERRRNRTHPPPRAHREPRPAWQASWPRASPPGSSWPRGPQGGDKGRHTYLRPGRAGYPFALPA